ncbi:response regulator [Bacillus licheniformis]
MLEGVPYQVIAAKSGHEALEVVSRSKLDLVILDLMMPDMTGFEVCMKNPRKVHNGGTSGSDHYGSHHRP